MRRRIFAYGTLELAEIVRALLGRLPAHRPARLAGFTRGLLLGQPYPGITERTGAFTTGVLYEGISSRELRLLDRFESRIYERRAVRVRCGGARAVLAETYVVTPRQRHRITTRVWDAATFAERYLAEYEPHCASLRRSLDGQLG